MTASMVEILVVWLAALLLGMPLFASMGLAAFAFIFLNGFPVDMLPQKLAQSANSFPLLAAPLFILMGNIMNSSGTTDRIFGFATACVGWIRGGLCHANILASIIFAGMSGSAVADAGGVGALERLGQQAQADQADRHDRAGLHATAPELGELHQCEGIGCPPLTANPSPPH